MGSIQDGKFNDHQFKSKLKKKEKIRKCFQFAMINLVIIGIGFIDRNIMSVRDLCFFLNINPA